MVPDDIYTAESCRADISGVPQRQNHSSYFRTSGALVLYICLLHA